MGAVSRNGPGFVLAGGITLVALALGTVLPVVGSPVIAIVLGTSVAIMRRPGAAFQPGLGFVSKRVLQWSVVLIGAGLSLHDIETVGVTSLPVLGVTLLVALTAATVVGRMMGLSGDTRTLIGVGTAICGAAAIAAVDSVIAAPDAEVSYAVATIFTFNVIAVLIFPLIGHLLGMTQHAFGLWSGTAINDTSSVIAATSVYGHAARNYGVVVKLTRTLMIIPIVIAIAVWRTRHAGRGPAPSSPAGHAWMKVTPWFVGWFLVAAALNSVLPIPPPVHSVLSVLATILITGALGAIGASTRLQQIRSAGPRPLILGAVLWAAVAASSLGAQAITGRS